MNTTQRAGLLQRWSVVQEELIPGLGREVEGLTPKLEKLIHTVIADLNLISFRRLYRSAIDHHRQSTDARKYAFGTGGQFWGGGNTRVCRAVEAMFLCGNFFCPHGEYFRIAYFIKNVWKVKPILFQRFVELFAIRKRTAPRNNTPANPLGR